MSSLRHTLTDLLANLRAIHWHAWNTHWKAQGGDSYSDHLLFQRIYAGDGGGPSIDDQIDGLGERIIALFGNKAVDGVAISRKATDIHSTITGLGRVAGALALEQKALQRLAAVADKVAKGPAELRISLDNFVRELADARSTVIYLLQQRLAGGNDAYGKSGWDDFDMSRDGGLDLVPPVAIAGLLGLLLVGPFIVTPFVLKAFVPKWSYGRRVVAGFGVSIAIGTTLKLIRAAKEPAPTTLIVDAEGHVAEARPNNVVYLDDYRDLGAVVDEETEARFIEEQRGKLLGWAFMGLMGYVAYQNYKQGPNSPWQHTLWGPSGGVRR